MENLAPESITALTQTTLGAALLLMVVLFYAVVKMLLNHIKESDERWSSTVQKTTDSLNGLTKVQKESGDKIAESIERALLYSRNNNNG